MNGFLASACVRFVGYWAFIDESKWTVKQYHDSLTTPSLPIQSLLRMVKLSLTLKARSNA